MNQIIVHNDDLRTRYPSGTQEEHEHELHVGDAILQDDHISDDSPSSPDSSFDHTGEDMMVGVNDDVTHHLAHSGPIGVAAAAAIASCRRNKKRHHHFETNPSIRKRQQTRLLRKLKATLEEYTTRVGQQAILLAVTPAKGRDHTQSFKVFGSQPLENVVRNCRAVIVQELEQVLAHHAPQHIENPNLFELPALTVDGMPTSLEKMTQAQLRMFVPEMLKYSTGRSKPGWGKPEFKPVWWPNDVPWANVRCDVRSDEQKKMVNWTLALRSIVRNCYKHHGRDDLLPSFEEPQPPTQQSLHTVMQTINNPDGTLSIIQIETGQNPFTGHQVVTLADGTQAAVVQTLHGDEVMEASDEDLAANFAQVHEATLQHDGSIILTGTDNAGMSSEAHIIPASVYQTVVSRAGILSTTPPTSLTVTNSDHHEFNDIPESSKTVEIIAHDT